MDAKKGFSIILASFLITGGFAGLIIFSFDIIEQQNSFRESGEDGDLSSDLTFQPYYGETYSLYDAVVTYSYVSAHIQGAYSGYTTSFNLDNGNGVFFGQCIDIELTSLVDTMIYVNVELGRIFVCKEYGVQDMIVTKSYEATLWDGDTGTITVYAMCADMLEDAPMAGVYYDLGSKCTGSTYDVVSYISGNSYQGASGQCALWAVTDDADVDYLQAYGASSTDLNQAQGILDNVGISKNISPSGGLFGIPGFELIFVVCAVALILVWKRKR